MKITLKRRGNPSGQIKCLVYLKKDFTLKTTTNSTIISYDNYTIVYSSHTITKWEMILQKQLKLLAKKRLPFIHIPDGSFKINYCSFAKDFNYMQETKGQVFSIKNVAEVDITKAYYYTAFNIGLIDETFFNHCMELRKDVRLRLIGSMATCKVIREFKKGKVVNSNIEEDIKLRRAWFYICSIVDRCLRKCMEAIKDDFLFYWVDGIYYRYKNKDYSQDYNTKKIIRIFRRFNYKHKVIKCDEVCVDNRETAIRLNVVKEGETKLFSVPKQEVVKYFNDE